MNQMNMLRSYALRHYNKRLEELKYILKYTNHSKRKEKLIKKIKYNEKMVNYYENTIFMTSELVKSNNETLSKLELFDASRVRGGRGTSL